MEGKESLAGRGRDQRIVAAGLIAVLLLSMLVSATLGTIGASASPASAPTPLATPRSLRIGLSDLTAVTLNPNAITLVLEFIPVYTVYSTLVTRDSRLRAAPDLAHSWEVASDDVTWTFHLVDNAYFTDPLTPTDRSHPVTADDVVFSYYMVKNNSGSILNSYASSLDRIERVDDYTVRIVTTGPFAAMESTLTAVPIVPKYLWEGIADPVSNAPRTYPIGSGAMYYDPNSDLSSGPIILHRNPNWFGDAAYCQVPRPDEVRFILFTSSAGMIEEFPFGASDLDAIFNIPASSFLNAQNLQGEAVARMQVAGGFVAEIGVNVMTDELRDSLVASGLRQFHSGANSQILAREKVVRHAIAMSIDRAAIIRYAYQGLATEGDTLIPASNPWHYDVPAEEEYPFDTAAARALLNDAGWAYDSAGNLNPAATPLYKSGGTDGLIFRLYTPDSHSEFEPAVSNMSRWLRESGIVTTDERGNQVPGYEVKRTNQMNSIWKALDYDIWLWDWVFSRVSDPSVDILEVQTTEALGPTNDNGYSNATYDALYRESLVTVDPDARRAITDEMQRMLYDYAGYIIPYYADDLYAVTSVIREPRGYAWQNWGDWSTHPGLTIDSALAAPWLNVYPSDNPPPIITAFPSINFVAGSSTRINAIVSDNEASLTFTWDFGDGSAPQTTTTAAVDHTFAEPGTYSVRVRVQDSEWPVCATSTATIGEPTGNVPPVATLDIDFPAAGHGWENESISFEVTVSDEEGNPLYITWDFGDDTTATNYVTSTQTASTVTRAHTYANAGNYTLRVTVTDNVTGTGHVQEQSSPIAIWKRPSDGGGPAAPSGLNPLINYGLPLGILAVILIAAAAVFMTRRKARREEARREEGQEQRPPPPPPSS